MPFSLYRAVVKSHSNLESLDSRIESSKELGDLSYADWSSWATLSIEVQNNYKLKEMYDEAFLEGLELARDQLRELIDCLISLRQKILDENLEIQNSNMKYLDQFISNIKEIYDQDEVFLMY